ncbi:MULTISPECIES: hypothetical protein [unclassified Streptomyces]|uniref:hypothetical protein n=1 Tax=unclassified Streptomyces TaxID=2593676 RepID=UPI00081D4B25|nr:MULTISPECIES: hypothetical protein [unclassified Streptomyces]MYR28652.1 hypothetical protein [Streptomyces sp. SID4945]SCF40113.1 hypothetical protein GA0115257_11568 [Streptomyces sp. LcepLS]
MPTDDAHLKRLADRVKDRRLALNLARKRAAQMAGMSKDTWYRIEDASPVRDMSYAKIDEPLQWAPGSARSVLEGREPIPVTPVEGAAPAQVAEVPSADLDERAREAIQLGLLATSSPLTADEIRDLSDRVLQQLRERGIIR